MPATGGKGTHNFMIFALSLSFGSILLGGYYSWRNFKQKNKQIAALVYQRFKLAFKENANLKTST